MKRLALVLAYAMVSAGCVAPTPSSVRFVKAPTATPPVSTTKQFAVPVLMYHRVCELTPKEERSPLIRDLTVDPADFEIQVKYLVDNGYTFLWVSEVEQALIDGLPLPEKGIALTFDDGYRDNFTRAFPILKKYGAKATVFMTTSNFGRPDRLSVTDAKAMVAGHVGFQSHTVTHPDLTAISESALKFELEESKALIEMHLKSRVTSLAYPAGAHDDRVVEAVRAANYVAAWDKGGGPVEPRHATDPYRLPRVRVHGKTDMKAFKRKVESGIWAIKIRTAKQQLRPS